MRAWVHIHNTVKKEIMIYFPYLESIFFLPGNISTGLSSTWFLAVMSENPGQGSGIAVSHIVREKLMLWHEDKDDDNEDDDPRGYVPVLLFVY